MNAVTSASSTGAASAAVLPGAPAGAAAAQGPSFDDVLQQLSGGRAPGAASGSGASRAATGRGVGDSDQTAAADQAAAGDDSTGMGTLVVPVTLVFQSVQDVTVPDATANPAAGDSTDVTTAGRGGSNAWSAMRRSSIGTAAGAGTTTGTTPSSAPPVGAGTGAGVSTGVLVPAGSTVGAHPAGPDSTVIDTLDSGRLPSPGDDLGPLDGTPFERGTVPPHVTPGGSPAPPSAPGLDRTMPVEAPPPAPPGPVRTPLELDPLITPVPNDLDQSTDQAAVMARLIGSGRRQLDRTMPYPAARPVDSTGTPVSLPGSESGSAPGTSTADTAAATAIAMLDASVSGGAVSPTAASVIAAAVRGQHPATAAALRAFQQAGAPASTDGASTASAGAQDSSTLPGLGARMSARSGAMADVVAAAVEPDRRPLTAPAVVVPLSSGDLRLGGDLPAAARAEAALMTGLTPADGESVHAQLVQSIRVQWTGGNGEARVRLRPEVLGDVVATIKVEQGVVTATLQADRAEVRAWMEANTQTLRDALGEHGLKLDRLVVLPEAAPNETADDRQGRARGRQPQTPPQPRPRRPRQDGAAPTFDVNL